MPSEIALAALMYGEYRRKSNDPTALPAWGNLPTDERVPWEAAAGLAANVVIEGCANKLGEAVMEAMSSGATRTPESDAHVKGVAWAAQHLRGKV